MMQYREIRLGVDGVTEPLPVTRTVNGCEIVNGHDVPDDDVFLRAGTSRVRHEGYDDGPDDRKEAWVEEMTHYRFVHVDRGKLQWTVYWGWEECTTPLRSGEVIQFHDLGWMLLNHAQFVEELLGHVTDPFVIADVAV